MSGSQSHLSPSFLPLPVPPLSPHQQPHLHLPHPAAMHSAVSTAATHNIEKRSLTESALGNADMMSTQTAHTYTKASLRVAHSPWDAAPACSVLRPNTRSSTAAAMSSKGRLEAGSSSSTWCSTWPSNTCRCRASKVEHEAIFYVWQPADQQQPQVNLMASQPEDN